MNNEQIMNTLLKYDNLQGLKYENDTLFYKDQSVNLKNINLMDFFSNPYSQLNIDQKTISAEDFFNIIKIHSITIEPTDEDIRKEKDIDDLEKYALNMLSNKGE